MSPQDKSIGAWLGEFERHFLATAPQATPLEQQRATKNWRKHYWNFYRWLPLEQPLNDRAIEGLIYRYRDMAYSYSTVITRLKALCAFCEYDFKFDPYRPRKKSNANHLTRDTAPSDDAIVEAYHRFSSPIKTGKGEGYWEVYRWMFGMMATYGLRDHETLHIINLTQEIKLNDGTIIPPFVDNNNDLKNYCSWRKHKNRY
ncbi:MAG: hypothetical protein HC796_04650 [Synechococcaceae cyanobacterium RL_1_2]|nr:hypothetical protein [Synechococcaceae cyanobacterium RL_1_2]